MEILFWLLQLFIWIIVLGFSAIPGIIAGSFSEALFGAFGYWPGYIIGTIAFLIVMSPLLFLMNKVRA